MADNLETKVAKLVKYGNEKFGLSETTLRGVLDNASGSEDLDTELNTQDSLLADLEDNINNLPEAGSSTEWQPNPTWWDIEKIYNEDTTEGYTYKAILLMFGGAETDLLKDYFLNYSGVAIRTSDGAFYENITSTITHTWDLTKDKPCLIDDKEVYTTRYMIVYTNSGTGIRLNNGTIMTCGYIGSTSSTQVTSFQNKYSLQAVINNDVSKYTSFYQMFTNCVSLKSIPQIDTSNGTNFESMFNKCYSLQTAPHIDTSNGTDFSNMFNKCYSLQIVPQIDTSNGTNFSYMFNYCYSLQTIPQIDISNGTNFSNMFTTCSSLQTIPQIDTSSGTNFSNMFNNCSALQIVPQINTSNGTNFSGMFYGCYSLQVIPIINLINATNISNMFTNCNALINLTLKNIKLSLQIGSGTTWGHLLTLDSLLNTIKELHDNTSGSSTLTLTVGSANLTKLANVYVKLVTITDEMRAEDEYIDLKKPFEVCESTDASAMTIEEYVTSKSWALA